MKPIVRLLLLKKLTRRFGGVVALDSLDLNVHEGEVLGLIGPNGAGKTTAFNVVTGLYAPTEGDVIFKGKNLVGLKPSAVTSRGIARTFQNIRLFRGMTVLENVLIGRHCKMRTGPVGAIFRLPGMVAEEHQAVAEAMELLKFTGIDAYASGMAEALSYGDQRRLEIARALASEPSLLLLDEPAAGMNPSEEERAQRVDTGDSRSRRHHFADRTRHEGGHGHLGPRGGAGPRGEDCGWNPRPGAARPQGAGSLFGDFRCLS